MRYLFRICLGMIISICSCIIHTRSAVTYLNKGEWGGRLGDRLLMFTKAKYFAYRYKLPLFYKPFDYSDQLAMHDRLPHYDGIREKYKKVLCKEMNVREHINPNSIMYKIHYFFKFSDWDTSMGEEIMFWPGVFSDKKFLEELKKDIAPRRGGKTINLPNDKITVAVHIRQGGGVDAPLFSEQLYKEDNIGDTACSECYSQQPHKIYADQGFPLKFPPLQYYVDQIKHLSEMFGNKPMYVYIYTDSKDPVAVMNLIGKVVSKKNITFNCRKNNNTPQMNVLEDLFAMAQYDCLVRSGSNYAQISQLIGDHKIVIYPISIHWEGRKLIVDQAGIYIRD